MRGSARGSVVLMIGQVVSIIISAATMIWVANVLGSEEFGKYTMAFLPVSLALLFQDLGMNTALMRFCSMYRHDKQPEKLKPVVMTGLLFSILTSVIISGIMYGFAGPIASLFLKHSEVEPLVKAASLAVLGGGGLLSTIQAIFVGYEIMSMRSISQILWNVLRTIFSYVLIMTGLGAFGAMLASTSAYLIAGLIGVLLLFIVIKFEPNSKGGFQFDVLKTLLVFGLPLSIGSLLGGIQNQIYNYLMVTYVAVSLIGNYGAASNFGYLVFFLIGPISTALFPLFSKFKQDSKEVKEIFQMSVKYTTLVSLPVVMAVIVVATPLSRILYNPTDYPLVPFYLSIYILNFAWEGLGGTSLGNLISGIGESKTSLVANIITFVTGIILAIILVPIYGMAGLLVTVVLDARGGWLYQILWTKKKLGFSVDWLSSFKLYGTAFIAFIASYLIIYIPNLQGWTALILGGATYFIFYLVGLPLSGALNVNDLQQLNSIADALGPLAPIARIVIKLMGYLIKK
jgi:O-antigen/teichoic acid export membrane protein